MVWFCVILCDSVRVLARPWCVGLFRGEPFGYEPAQVFEDFSCVLPSFVRGGSRRP